ncbi:MAG: PRC-barrel domain-containing protein [Caldilineaceae bacterium]|nr:PRC-barrel domain-containing protein [Caldilineaceae bacterium]
MQTAQEVIGKQVISIDQGAVLGKVRDLYFDPQLQRLVALSLGGGGIFGSHPKSVQLENVVVLGNDAVLVKSASDVQEGGEGDAAAAWMRLHDLRGREVTTTGGTPIGKLDDVTLGEDGQVLDIMLAWTRVEGPIGKTNMVTRRSVVDAGAETQAITIDLAMAEQEQGGAVSTGSET